MSVLKFGGTSIGNVKNIKNVVNLINCKVYKIVVFSAFSEVTNLLSEFVSQSNNKNYIKTEQVLSSINFRHLNIISELFSTKKFEEIAKNKLSNSIKLLSSYMHKNISLRDEKIIIAQGELLSVMIIYLYALEQGLDVAYIPALKFMKTNKYDEPDFEHIENKLNKELKKYTECYTVITSGFICNNLKGEISNLGRGASDYSATIIGNVLNAPKVEIWTDIDGIHNNDPRFVEHTQSISNLSYEEAGELAFFGAKILHPASIKPAQDKGIPVIVKNTMEPLKQGTVISNYSFIKGIKGIASKDEIITIKLRSGKMMQAYGFLKRIFEVFEKYKTSVDMLTTSEITVAMTIDNETYLNNIIEDLSHIGSVEIIKKQSIISIVGSFYNSQEYIQSIINGFDNIPIQMISFGSSKNNISFVIDTEYKVQALNILNQHLFKNNLCLINN